MSNFINQNKDGKAEDKHKELLLQVEGMDCPRCASSIEIEVSKAIGTDRITVNYLNGEMKVYTDPNNIKKVTDTIKSLGFGIADKNVRIDGRTDLYIKNMDCADEEKAIRQLLENQPEINSVKFNLMDRKLSVFHSGDLKETLKILQKNGFKAEIFGVSGKMSKHLVSARKLNITILAAIIIVAGSILKYTLDDALFYIPVLLLGMVLGGWPIAWKGFIAARNFRLDMNFLMTVAVIGAAVLGDWVEAATVVVLFSIAQLLEAYSLQRSNSAIKKLLTIVPQTAIKLTSAGQIQISIDEISKGDIILVKPGETIPIDGIVVSGASAVNEAAITGESLPVYKQIQSQVFAGTLNTDGALEIETTHIHGQTTLDRIIRTVEDAQSQKAPTQNFIDRFSVYYTPAVVAIAIIIAIFPPLFASQSWSEWIYRALTLLVISCPCALVISTPITIVSALANAARHGVLIKGGIFIENAHKIDAILFDKTGTITTGNPSVVGIESFHGHNIADILKMAAAIESKNSHPIANAIVKYSKEQGQLHAIAVNAQSIPGKGAFGEIDGRIVYVGNHRLFEEIGACKEGTVAFSHIHEFLKTVELESQTAILVGTREMVMGVIAISDQLRPQADKVIKELKSLGIKRLTLLTGDNHRTAAAIAEAVGIEDVHPELLPEQKVKFIKDAQKEFEVVAMVGDGVNDAPALATAEIGIAMGAIGSDSAIEAADIALMKDELSRIPWLIRLSKKAYGIIIANIILAIGIKFVFVIMAAMGLATLWMAVFADMGVSLMVIANGLRALRNPDNMGDFKLQH